MAIDVDFTLVGDDLEIGPRPRKAVRAALDAGCIVTLASGRMFRSTAPLARELGIQAPIVTYDGALIKAIATDEVISHRPMSGERAREVLEYARSTHIHLNTYVDDTLYVERYDDETVAYMSRTMVEAVVADDIAALMARRPTKLLMIAAEAQMDHVLPDVQARFGSRLHVVRSMPQYIEVTARGVSKGNGLARLARWLGVAPAEVMAIGDSDNDISMLQYAGLGVAVGNARSHVKEIADFVTEGEAGDGVSEAIERFVLR